MTAASKPMLLFCATPVFGHVMPIRAIAKAIIKQGYSVMFLTGSDYKEAIEDIGATFVPLRDEADLTAAKIGEIIQELEKLREQNGAPPGVPDQIQQRCFIDVIPKQFEGIQATITAMKSKSPEAPIVIVSESAFRGALPLILGAEGVKADGYVGIGIVPIVLSSIDTAPFGPGLPPDNSVAGRAKNTALIEAMKANCSRSQARYEMILEELGAQNQNIFWKDAPYLLPLRFVQMCVPSLEYPRSDAPTNIRFAGGLLPGLRDPMKIYPEWWSEISTNPDQRKIVFVCQGTISWNLNDLLIPTMQAFQNDKSFLVVAALGRQGIQFPEGVDIPDNCRIIDFIPYDEILAFTDVFVTNGGYGAVQHALGCGVPMVVAGTEADKAENAMRVEWAGAGLNLRTQNPSIHEIRNAVNEILAHSSYERRAKELQSEMQSYDPIKVVLEAIEFAASADSKEEEA